MIDCPIQMAPYYEMCISLLYRIHQCVCVRVLNSKRSLLGFVGVTRRVPPVEQERITLYEHLRSPTEVAHPIFSFLCSVLYIIVCPLSSVGSLYCLSFLD